VAIADSQKILRFKAGDSGNVSPQATGQFTQHSLSLALDVSHDRLVALGGVDPSFLLFDNASKAFGSSLPRVISGPATTLGGPTSAAFDGAADLLYVVVNSSNILVFGPASTVTGNVAPQRTINLGFRARGMVLDPGNNRLFVSDIDNTAIKVFDNASTLSGAVLPTRTISGAATQLSFPGDLLLDSAGRLIVVGNSGPPATILVFANAGAANGNVAPAAASVIDSANQIAVSPSGDLYVVASFKVAVYGNIASASGALTPIRVVSGSNSGLDPPFPPGAGTWCICGVALDPTR
jgi:hypothetical protein